MRDEKPPKRAGAKSKTDDRNKGDDQKSKSASSLRPRPAPLPVVAVVMGSKSDWETMRHAAEVLRRFGVAHESRVISAHRTPGWMADFAVAAEGRGLKVIIAGAGGAAHLPGMIAAHTVVPVLGVPVESKVLRGFDSLLSIVQMPAGVPVGTLAVGQAGATNAGLLAVSILANEDERLRARLRDFRREQERQVREATLEENDER